MKIRPQLRAIVVGLAALITLLWVANFFWTLSLGAQYGGGALNGFVRDGHYYLGQHGGYTQVSQAIWEQIRLHELGIWLGVPFVVVGFSYLLFSLAFPAVMGLRQGGSAEERVQAGSRIGFATCRKDLRWFHWWGRARRPIHLHRSIPRRTHGARLPQSADSHSQRGSAQYHSVTVGKICHNPYLAGYRLAYLSQLCAIQCASRRPRPTRAGPAPTCS